MGSKILDLVDGKKLDLRSLRGKTLAVDAFNTLYMFLTTIRGRDGTPLQNKDGKMTSHLVGIFNRFTKYLELGIKFVFVFDGKAPDLKSEEVSRRKDLKKEAKKKYEKAKQEENVENMKKYAARSVFLTEDLIKESKELITLMGMGVVEAPSEGEAQAAHIVKQGDAYAVVSQDADSLLAGAPRVIRNLNTTKRRKLPGRQGYTSTNPEIIHLDTVLTQLEINLDQLLLLAMLVGTDYNYGGVKGVGPKRGIKLVKKYKGKPNELFEHVQWSDNFDVSWEKVFETLKNVEVKTNYSFETKDFNPQGIKELLVNKNDFSASRVENNLEKLHKAQKVNKQTGLQDFF